MRLLLTCTLTFKWDLMSKHNEDLPQTKMKMFHRQLWCKLTTLPPSPSHHNLTKLFSRNHREPRRFLRHCTEASFVEWSGSLQQRPKALAVNANRKGTLVNRQCNKGLRSHSILWRIKILIAWMKWWFYPQQNNLWRNISCTQMKQNRMQTKANKIMSDARQ